MNQLFMFVTVNILNLLKYKNAWKEKTPALRVDIVSEQTIYNIRTSFMKQANMKHGRNIKAVCL